MSRAGFPSVNNLTNRQVANQLHLSFRVQMLEQISSNYLALQTISYHQSYGTIPAERREGMLTRRIVGKAWGSFVGAG
jgi:hypothetical protein